MKFIKRIKNTFSHGSGTLIMGTFMIVGIFAFILMFMEIYQVRENYINTKAAADTIADGAALYAMDNYDASYASMNKKAKEIKSVIKDEMGINVGSISTSKDDFSDNIVTVDTKQDYHYLTNFFSSEQYDLTSSSGTEFSPQYWYGSSNIAELQGVVFNKNGSRNGCQAVVDLALAQYGRNEADHSADIFVGGGSSSATPWCAAFVSWCMSNCPEASPYYPAKGEWACASAASIFKSKGQWGDRSFTELVPGDVIYYDFSGIGVTHHTGIVIGVSGTNVWVVEGNKSNCVGIRTVPIGSQYIYGYGLMNYPDVSHVENSFTDLVTSN